MTDDQIREIAVRFPASYEEWQIDLMAFAHALLKEAASTMRIAGAPVASVAGIDIHTVMTPDGYTIDCEEFANGVLRFIPDPRLVVSYADPVTWRDIDELAFNCGLLHADGSYANGEQRTNFHRFARALLAAPSDSVQKAVTVWRDGRWKIWATGDAGYAQNDPDWLATIPLAAPSTSAQQAAPVVFNERASVWKVQNPETGYVWFTEAREQALREARDGKTVTGFGSAIAAPAPSASAQRAEPGKSTNELAKEIWAEICELPDRYWSESEKEACISNFGEFLGCVERVMERLAAAAPSGSPAELTGDDHE